MMGELDEVVSAVPLRFVDPPQFLCIGAGPDGSAPVTIDLRTGEVTLTVDMTEGSRLFWEAIGAMVRA